MYALWNGSVCLSDEPLNIDPLSEEGAKPTEVKGALEFKNIFFAYPARPNMQVQYRLDQTGPPFEPRHRLYLMQIGDVNGRLDAHRYGRTDYPFSHYTSMQIGEATSLLLWDEHTGSSESISACFLWPACPCDRCGGRGLHFLRGTHGIPFRGMADPLPITPSFKPFGACSKKWTLQCSQGPS